MKDLLDPELHATGEAAIELDELRARCPIAWRDGRRGPGYWAVTGYPELVAIAKSPQAFTSYLGTRPEVRRAPAAPRPLHNLDPPAHTALRAIANQLVAPSRVNAIAPAIVAIVVGAIDAFVTARGGDAIPPLAIAVPAQIFAAWMGLPDGAVLATRVEAVHRAGAALLDAPTNAPARHAARDATVGLASWLREVITSGSAPPASVLADLHARVASGELSLQDATMLAALLVEAGLPTLSDAIAGGLALVRARPKNAEELAFAIEEVLRVHSPIQQFARFATRDVTVAGVDIRAGEQLILWFGAANRDPRAFDDPAAFELRAKNAHVAFGAGPHRCLGARFARDMLRTFFTAWFARVPRHEARGVRRPSSYMNSYASLIISLPAK